MKFGIKTTVTDEYIYNGGDQYMQYVARDLQVRMGEFLVDAIWRGGGTAVVSLEMRDEPDRARFARDISLLANVSETERFTQKIYVPHFEYFPLDWVCVYCGTLNDGIRHPRECCNCRAPKQL